MDTPKKKLTPTARVLLAVVPVLVALLAVSLVFGERWLLTVILDGMKASTAFWLLIFWPIIALLAAGVTAVVLGSGRPDKRYEPGRPTKKKVVGLGAAAVLFALVNLFVPGVGLLGSQAWRAGYESSAQFAGNVSESASPHPTYLPRVNSVQAEKIVQQLLNDPSISETTPAQYTRIDDAPAWCVGGLGQKDRLGRQYTTTAACITEDGSIVKAAFTAPVPSINGRFSTNLSKKIAEMKPGLSVAGEDLRFFIEDGKPVMIASATRRTAGIHSITLPAGVFVYRSDGSVEYDADVSPGEYKVAVLPYKVARDLRSSLNTRAGYWCVFNLNKPRCLKENTPYEATNTVNGTQAPDANAVNSTEFVLQRTDGSFAMVTPLTNYGRGLNITAYFEVPADSLKAGVIPSATLFKGVNEVSHKVIVQTLTPAYTSDLTWLTEIDGAADDATASRIFEITPTQPGKMRLTIGTATNPQYVVEIDSTLEQGSTAFSWCISTDSFTGQDARKIECRKSTDGEAPIGTLRGLNLNGSSAPADGSTGSTGTKPPATDLAGLTDEELVKLIEDAAAELARR